MVWVKRVVWVFASAIALGWMALVFVVPVTALVMAPAMAPVMALATVVAPVTSLAMAQVVVGKSLNLVERAR